MMKRKSISKKTRFEIFKRDLFTCQYCGGHPPKVVLEIDHIVAVASGGDNDITNLGVDAVIDAVEIALGAHIHSDEREFKYFCGVCCNIRDQTG